MHKIALMVSNLCLHGGTERVTVNLSKELNKYYDCRIITRWCNGEYAYDLDPYIEVFNLYNHEERFRHIFIDATRRIRKYILDEGIEAIIVVGRNNGIIPLLVKLSTPVKLIYCEHNSLLSYEFMNESFRQKVYRKILQQLMLHVPDGVVTLTNRDLAHYQGTSMRACSIYNNIDDRLLTDSKYDCESKKIITVGRMAGAAC